MKGRHENTTAFYTLDGCHSNLLSTVFRALMLNREQPDNAWKSMCEHPKIQDRFRTQGVDNWESRDTISWDDPTVLFTLTRMLNDEGLPIMLGEDRNRERFGRFPHPTGSTIQYVRENIRNASSQTNDLFEDLVTHLDYLLIRCSASKVGADRYLGGGWTVAKDEPIDGGVRDAIRHLNALLIAAERRNAGLIHRMHA